MNSSPASALPASTALADSRCEFLFTESSPHLGGQEFQLLQQMQQLQGRGLTVILACRPHSRILGKAQELGLQALAVPFRNALHWPTIQALRRLYDTQRPRCVICHSGHDANAAAVAARLARHRPLLIRSKTYVAGKPSAWSHNRLVDLTIVPSEFLRRQLLELNPRIDATRLKVVHPGIDFERMTQEAHAPLPPMLAGWLGQQSGPVIVQVGMLRGEKGHAVILDALALLSQRSIQRFGNVRYVAAGSGERRESLLAKAQALGLSQRLWIGELRPVAPLLQLADLLVMPSTYEPLGMAQIEALSLGTPVLASRTGGIPETVTDQVTGLLVPPGDVTAWANAIEHALQHPQRLRSMAAAGQAQVRATFSMQQNTEALLKLAP
jgi:glycosyltransferase involved in cell wall biosynthesis